MPGGAPLRRNVGHQHHGLRIVGVDVENGRVDDPAYVSAVGRGAGVARICREPDLVVGYDVDSSLDTGQRLKKYLNYQQCCGAGAALFGRSRPQFQLQFKLRKSNHFLCNLECMIRKCSFLFNRAVDPDPNCIRTAGIQRKCGSVSVFRIRIPKDPSKKTAKKIRLTAINAPS